jgi:hypothetical protein
MNSKEPTLEHFSKFPGDETIYGKKEPYTPTLP